MSAQDYAQLAQNDELRRSGVLAARTRDQATREIAKIKTRSTVEGFKVLAVISLLVLMFLYNQVFQNNTRLLWILTSVLAIALLFKFGSIVKEDGGLSFGYY